MYTLIAIGLSVLAGSIWLQIWNKPDIVIMLGVVIIVFGYWWKWYWYWRCRSGAYTTEYLEDIRKKKEQNYDLTFHEQDVLFLANEGQVVIYICNKIGVAIIAIGLLLTILS